MSSLPVRKDTVAAKKAGEDNAEENSLIESKANKKIVDGKKSKARSKGESPSAEKQPNPKRSQYTRPSVEDDLDQDCRRKEPFGRSQKQYARRSEFDEDRRCVPDNESGRRPQRSSQPHSDRGGIHSSIDKSGKWRQCPPRSRSQRVGQKGTEEHSPLKHHHGLPRYIPTVANSPAHNIGTPDNPYELQLNHPEWLPIETEWEDIIDYEFKCKGLLREAVFPIQDGWAHIIGRNIDGTEVDRYQHQGNRKLAMMGDNIMRGIMTDVWLRYETKTVATLHRDIRYELNNPRLQAAAENRGMDRLVKLFFRDGRIVGKHVLPTTLRAIIGAVWYDTKKHGRKEIRKVMDRLLRTRLEEEHAK